MKLVSETGIALDGMVHSVAEIDALIEEIARSSQEQATGLSQVNSAVNHMDQVTQENAAMVEETTAAADGLRVETDELMHLVGQFETGMTASSAQLRTPPASRLSSGGGGRMAKGRTLAASRRAQA